ncbi:MAG: hypothetical protein IGS48_20825 [Oscillatoriales cyanobacterium C42_A2020_001]|nr:hypothetical protein [Leptolyngbyaceae cyanobacterium C42_A2020_001]
MLNPWLILGTVAFIASFGISLLMTGDLGGALIAGASALATGLATAATVNWYHNRSSESRMAALKHQIRLLQRRRAEEQQAVLEITAEKERVIQALNSMQDELRQRQLPGSNPYARPALSWNLSSQSADNAQVAIAEGYSDLQPEFQPASLNQFVTEAAATKQKITASLNHLQSELSQLNSQVSDQRQVREQLLQEITQLSQQQQGLTQTAKELTQDIEELERCRAELDQYVVYVETKKQELEAGSNPLQKALKQLQSQVTALQEELRSLEAQVTTKRQEKATLERELSNSKQHQHQATPLHNSIQKLENQKSQLEREVATLKQQQEQSRILQDAIQQLENQKSQLERDLTHLKQQQSQLKASQDSLQKLEKQISDRRREKESLEKQITQLQAQKTALRNQPNASKSDAQLELQTEVVASAQNGKGQPALQRPGARPQPQLQEDKDDEGDEEDGDEWEDENEDDEAASEQELSELWTEFMLQLPEYELQALKAIAYESNPTRVLNRIAEDNFTTPEEMLASINQLAEEMVGEIVINTRAGFAPPAIARDHQRTIKKVIETYEYLSE